ncbi:MAG TPA: SUF system NifU family Fe-S cluster assembly protein [Luteimicrobium sp.]|nr:SUF system NifU family Fe-S cluster assembly protein [Luteimicrobium sp.]
MTNQLEQLYQQVILDHARSAHGRGLAVAEAVGHAHGQSHQVNPTCGDEVTLRVSLSGPGPGGAATLEQVSWDGQGCSISQASLSVLTDLVTGRSAEEAEQLGETFRALMASQGKGLDESLEDALGDATAFTGVSQFPARIKCALLGWAALRDALAKAGAASATQDLSQEES